MFYQFLVDCIWAYYRCANKNENSDMVCKENFNGCSMLAMGMSPNITLPTTTTTTTTQRLDLKVLLAQKP